MISNDFLKFICQIYIEFWIRNTSLQKFLQIDMIFIDQFKVLMIKFGKCFAEFMIPMALLKEFPDYLISSAELSDDCVSTFTSLVRAKNESSSAELW